MNPPTRILLIRPSALGDVCRTVPVLVTCKRAWPDASVDWLVQEGLEDAIVAHPDLHQAIPFPRHALGRDLMRGRAARTLRFIKDLRGRDYDLVLDAQGLLRSGLIARATGARRRIGHRAAREFAWLCYTDRETGSEGLHTVDRMLALTKAAGLDPQVDMRLFAPSPDRLVIETDSRFAEPFAVLAPTSRWPGKQWPPDRFDALACALLESRLIARVAIVGSASERPQCAPLLARAERDPRVLDLVGATSIGRLMALIEQAALVVANDSAALHMAVGFDRPSVALFGPTRIDLVGPYRREDDVVQHIDPTDHLDHKDASLGGALMARITTQEVIEASLARLAPNP